MPQTPETRPPRILYLITDLNEGGAQRAVRQLAVAMARRGWEVRVACLFGVGAQGTALREAGVEVIDLHTRSKVDLLVFRRARAMARRFDPDVVHAFLYHANFVARALSRGAAGRPFVITGERTLAVEPRWAEWVNRLTQRHSDLVLAVSEQVRKDVVERVGLSARLVEVLDNGVDTEAFSPGAPEPGWLADHGVPSARGPVVGTLARLAPQKRLDLLIEVFARILEVHEGAVLLIGGTGNERERLRARVASLGLESAVRFLGYVEDVAPMLRCLDLFMLPSAQEGMPNALLEAMACGIPSVCTAVGGVTDIIDSGTEGLLCPPGDVDCMRLSALAILGDETLARRLGEASRARVMRDFSLSGMLDKAEAYYRAAIADIPLSAMSSR